MIVGIYHKKDWKQNLKKKKQTKKQNQDCALTIPTDKRNKSNSGKLKCPWIADLVRH